MKRSLSILALALAVLMILSLAACGSSNKIPAGNYLVTESADSLLQDAKLTVSEGADIQVLSVKSPDTGVYEIVGIKIDEDKGTVSAGEVISGEYTCQDGKITVKAAKGDIVFEKQ